MKKMLLILLCSLVPLITYAQVTEEDQYFKVDYIQSLMKKVTDWQLNHLVFESGGGLGNMEKVRNDGWIRGTLYVGVMATYQSTGDPKYLQACKDFAAGNGYKIGPITRHADHQTVGQVYLELYDIEQDEKYIKDLKDAFDLMYNEPKRGPVAGWSKSLNWSWSDALFMAPPSIARLYKNTGDEKYIDLLNMYYWDTYDYLYDKKEHLFYRDDRYIYSKDGKAKTMSGKKVFWLRGNAWVIGGLARVLDNLTPKDKGYDKFLALYKEMADRFLELQQIDGLWRPSMLEPKQFPEKETSGSSFACFALAWGLNKGILDKEKFLVPTMRAWQSLTECVDPEGMLRWVQLTGHDPQHIKSTDTMEYGVGAFLLAAREMYKMAFINSVSKRYREDSIF